MKQKINYAALLERHSKAIKWEGVRAAYFQRTGKLDNAGKCQQIIQYHERSIKTIQAGGSPAKAAAK